MNDGDARIFGNQCWRDRIGAVDPLNTKLPKLGPCGSGKQSMGHHNGDAFSAKCFELFTASDEGLSGVDHIVDDDYIWLYGAG